MKDQLDGVKKEISEMQTKVRSAPTTVNFRKLENLKQSKAVLMRKFTKAKAVLNVSKADLKGFNNYFHLHDFKFVYINSSQSNGAISPTLGNPGVFSFNLHFK